MKSREELKFLLLQIRYDHETQRQEFLEFLEFGRLHDGQLDNLNVYNLPNFQPQIIDSYDGLFIGGSSDASVLKPTENEFLPASYALIRYCYDIEIPVFASCFGFQVAVMELGGEIIEDKDNMEMGCLPIICNDAAKDDPLCHDLPASFYAICGHKERATSLPADAINLASTPLCPYQMFKIKDKPFYASQFHPEVSLQDFITRITRYQERYFTDESLFKEALAQAEGHDTTIANDLMANFIDRIVTAD